MIRKLLTLISVVAAALALAACSPSKTNSNFTSEYWWPGDNEQGVLISADLNDKVVGHFLGAANARHLVVKFDGTAVIDGLLNDRYEGVLSGSFNGRSVEVKCHYPIVSGMWREVRCAVEVDGEWAANLNF